MGWWANSGHAKTLDPNCLGLVPFKCAQIAHPWGSHKIPLRIVSLKGWSIIVANWVVFFPQGCWGQKLSQKKLTLPIFPPTYVHIHTEWVPLYKLTVFQLRKNVRSYYLRQFWERPFDVISKIFIVLFWSGGRLMCHCNTCLRVCVFNLCKHQVCKLSDGIISFL